MQVGVYSSLPMTAIVAEPIQVNLATTTTSGGGRRCSPVEAAEVNGSEASDSAIALFSRLPWADRMGFSVRPLRHLAIAAVERGSSRAVAARLPGTAGET